jgi:hypothetical protein
MAKDLLRESAELGKRVKKRPRKYDDNSWWFQKYKCMYFTPMFQLSILYTFSVSLDRYQSP